MIHAIPFTAFVISLLLALGGIDPSRGWLVTLSVLTGVEALPSGAWRGRGPGNLRLAIAVSAFIIALLLALNAVDTSDAAWYVTLAAISGLLAFTPRASWHWRRRFTRAWATGWSDDDGW